MLKISIATSTSMELLTHLIVKLYIDRGSYYY